MTQESNVTEILTGDPGSEEFSILSGYGTRSFYGDDLDDEKTRDKIIKEIVSQVRRCPEYGRYRDYLIDNLDMGNCSILTNLDAEELENAEVELHHYPFTLYDIVEMVIGQMEFERVRFSTMAVAHRVMASHWKNFIGLVPLVKTIHELVHAGQYFLDPRLVFGNWREFLIQNRKGLTESIANRLSVIVAGWESPELEILNKQVLSVIPRRWIANPITKEELLSSPEDYEENEYAADINEVLEG
jgi:hypothetical protein